MPPSPDNPLFPIVFSNGSQPEFISTRPTLVVLQRQSRWFELVSFDGSDRLPIEIWTRIFRLLPQADLLACVVLKKRLSSAARLVLYRSLSFDNFSVAWWNAAFWQSGNGNAFRCATRSVTIGSANALDPLVGTLVTTVNSFPNLDMLTIINQEVHVADVFAMLQERNVKYLVLEDVALHRHKGPIPSLEPVRRECDLLPAAPSTIILKGVPWNAILDPFLLLPKTLGSPNLTFIEIDVRSFTAIVRAFPRVLEMLGANLNRFRMLRSEWHPGAKLQRSCMIDLRDALSGCHSSLQCIEVLVSCALIYRDRPLSLSNLTSFSGPEELLPMLGKCPYLEHLIVDSVSHLSRTPVLTRTWPSVRSIAILRWPGLYDNVANLLTCVPYITSFDLNCLPYIDLDNLMPLGPLLKSQGELSLIKLSFVGCEDGIVRDLSLLALEWTAILGDSVGLAFDDSD
ncbi:hypothetical protein PM082_009971 [Marasmius tenuissimus]|nr:hypothetical protein PM082_023429 [Marasmius tenuissimus]KAJ8094080.1 hypothetical protein PM082_009971 [Marasmius tenuissimus]